MTIGNRKFWKIAAGLGGDKWEEFKKENRIKIDFSLELDLSTLLTNQSTYEDFRSKTRELKKSDKAATMLWDFLKDLEIGDIIAIHKGESEICDLAVITSEYQFNSHSLDGYWHFRDVKFLNLGNKKLTIPFERQSTIYELKHHQIVEILSLYGLTLDMIEQLLSEKPTQKLKIIINQEELATFEPTELIGMEGQRREVIKRHLYIERDREFVEKYKQLFIVKQGKIQCQACGFDCEKYYNFGLKAENFLQLHHIEKLANREGTENTETYSKDVVLLCPNCHIAIHRLMEKGKEDKVISVEELQLHLFPY